MARSGITAVRRARSSAETTAPERVAVIAELPATDRVGETLARAEIAFTFVHDPEASWAKTQTAPVVLHMPAASAPETIERLHQQSEAPIVVVCDQVQRWEVRSMLAAGASGVVLEADVAHSLAPCLAAVRTGQICVPREHARQVEPPVLSTREKQILGLVVMGYMNSQIAEQLFLAESTVKSHLSSAFGKLGVRSRNEAVDLILDAKRGLGTGILALGGERLETTSAGTQ